MISRKPCIECHHIIKKSRTDNYPECGKGIWIKEDINAISYVTGESINRPAIYRTCESIRRLGFFPFGNFLSIFGYCTKFKEKELKK